MLLIGFLWLLYAQVALAAGKSHPFEIVLSYIGYMLQRRMYGDAQKFLFPLQSPITGKPIPENAGPDGKGLSFPSFVRLYINNRKITVVNVELDLDNPVRTGELLLARNYNAVAKVPNMKGVKPAEVDKNAVGDNKVFKPTLKDYRIFTEELAETYDLAAKTFGTGTNSPVYKELAAFEPLVARIRQERLGEMRMAKTMLKDIAAAFKGIDLKTTTYKDPIDIFGDTEARRIIQERFQLQDLPDSDPRIKAEWKNWLDGIGFRDKPTNSKAPPYSDINRKHLYVLNGWIGMEDHLRCQAKKYLS